MSAWLDGECPPGDPTTVRQRLDDIDGWITEDKIDADPALLEALNMCQTQATRVRGIQDYEVDNAVKLFSASGKAQSARSKAQGDPRKTDEWREARQELEAIEA